MEKAKYGYGWVLKFILAAILLGVGIFMAFSPDVVFVITGATILIFSVLRVVPLMKSLDKEVLRTINLIEVIFDFIIGGALVAIALTRADSFDTQPIWGMIYRYSLAFFFYVRGLVFFNSVVFFGEKTEIPKFWIHIAALSLGVVIAVVPNFDAGTAGIFFLVVALMGAGYLGYDGYGGYKKYREFSKQLNEGDRPAPTPRKEKGKELPSRIEEEERDETYVS